MCGGGGGGRKRMDKRERHTETSEDENLKRERNTLWKKIPSATNGLKQWDGERKRDRERSRKMVEYRKRWCQKNIRQKNA